jgi:hypothetical protein
MISLVPRPSAVNSTIRPRHTCFWGLFRAATPRKADTSGGAHVDGEIYRLREGTFAGLDDNARNAPCGNSKLRLYRRRAPRAAFTNAQESL